MERMPTLFVGHGSPMNAIDNNAYTKKWEELGRTLPRPKAILAVSAHWFTQGTRVTDAKAPKMVYDMYGFPQQLYEIVYAAPGDPALAHRVKRLIGDSVSVDNTWGIDHGTWSVLVKMFPEANVPVLQLSINRSAPLEEHYRIGDVLKPLRDSGVLIFGTGNIVHNLMRVNMYKKDGYPWAYEFDAFIKESILAHDHENVIQYERAGSSAAYAFTYNDHYAPLLYALGASDKTDKITVFNNSSVLGSISMTGYVIG
ncbi:MAG TPA: 4,5-DOPA dioxygenase extradiol [Clostridia bacterium]|nr:4,5-DOPA dioxygenase extradiol [Clostridia bacterium]